MKFLALCLLLLVSPALFSQLTYDPAQIIASQSGVVTVYSADLDGDGDLDLLTTATNVGIRWWSNDGAGNFSEAQYLQQNGDEAQSKCAALADYDQDGDIDVVAEIDTDPGNTGPVTVQYFINNGSGVFSNGLIIGSLAANIQEVQARDFDSDGDLDVLFAESSNDQIGWIENQGPSSFGTLEVLNTGAVNGAQTIDIADIDQDGDMDVVAAGEYDDEWTYHINNGGETMLGDFNIGNGDNVSSITVADINGDAFPDAFAVYGIDGDVVWAAGNGNGFDAPQFILNGNGFPDNFPITVEANDLDQDGLVDAVVCSILSNEVIWFRNLGGGNFGPQQTIGTGANNVRQTAVGDFDGDGDIDVAAALFGGGALVWYENVSPATVFGCTDDTACNYDPAAETDDGSCDFSCLGCTDSGACNYDSLATIDDGSCEYLTCEGCTDPAACNYDADAIIDNLCDYSCFGCMLEIACNYSPVASIDDGSCEFTSCAGCQDVNACDYDATAIYPAACDYTCLGCTDETACNYDATASIDNGTCSFSCLGCTDATACNYDSEATTDDGSCLFYCYGCLDPLACNYDAEVTIDDGSCVYNEVAGCLDPLALNYNPLAVNDAGTCLYSDQLCGAGTFWDNDQSACIGTGEDPNTCAGDLNDDQVVSAADLLMFLGVFGSACN